MSVKFLNSISFLTNIEDTLEKTSEYKETGSSTVEIMSNSQFRVINFDKVAEQYAQNKKPEIIEYPSSVDALFDIGQEIVFVEFKSGRIGRSTRFEVVKKFYETAFVLIDLVPNQFSMDYFKKNAVFILVFDSSKNNDGNDDKRKIHDFVAKKANSPIVRFGLAYIQNFCCKEMYTFDKQQFSIFLQDNGIT